MKSNKHITEENLDELLKAYTLNKYSEEENAVMAQMVIDKDYGITISKEKEKELLKQLNKNNKGRKWIWIGVTLFILITLFFLYKYSNERSKSISNPIIENNIPLKESKHSKLEVVYEIDDSTINTYYVESSMSSTDSIAKDEVIMELPNSKKVEKNKEQHTVEELFTDAELKFYHQLKLEMITKIIEQDKKIYTSVRESFVIYKKNKLGVDAFIARNFSVTNMEYKAFLVDLIRNKNEKTLEEVIVNEKGWLAYQCHQLANEYFKSKTYDAFPVVNISPVAALLFCKWLEKETNLHLKAKDSKAKPIKIRLPYDYEWISSAKIGKSQTVECDGYQTIYDISEGLVNKSFIKRLEKVRKTHLKKKKKYDPFFAINRYGMTENEILSVFKNTLDMPKNYSDSLSNISQVAHVSEFIQNKLEEIIVFGSCWENKAEYTQMLEEFKNQSTSPFIGFRFVVENEKLPTYKNPFW